jgi:hypothetical protein
VFAETIAAATGYEWSNRTHLAPRAFQIEADSVRARTLVRQGRLEHISASSVLDLTHYLLSPRLVGMGLAIGAAASWLPGLRRCRR